MNKENEKFSKISFFITLCLSVLSGILICALAYRFDNKYIDPYPAQMGIMEITAEELDDSAYFHLVDGWEYYDGKLLTPANVGNYSPDEYIYLGKYSGFDRGNPQKSSYGSATYRLTIFTDSRNRTYALELPEIYSEWKLYINGALRASSDERDDKLSLSGAENWMVTFEAQGSVEIVIAVSDYNHLYSGVTYPPAFGTPRSVGNLLIQRLMAHTAAAATAFMGTILCVLIGFGYRRAQPFYLLSLLCLCFIGCISYPFIQALHLTWDGWAVIERFLYYGFFFTMILLQRRLCEIPKKYSFPLAAVGLSIMLSVLIQPFVSIDKAAIKYIYSMILDYYKWLTALWLIGSSIWAMWKKTDYSRTLLAGAGFFASTLAMDRIWPLYEPIRFGWPVEIAGFIWHLLIAGILWRQTVKIYQDGLKIETELTLAQEKEKSLIEINDMKSQFLSNISHELQMPVTIISGYAQLAGVELGNATLDIPEIKKHLKKIIREGGRMEQMITQLLDETRIATDRFMLNIGPVSVAELITKIQETYFPMMDDNDNKLVTLVEPNMQPILCDCERILQILINLVSNACRHTHHGTITIAAGSGTKTVYISVSDNGEGMETAIQERLFSRYLSDGKTSGKARGIGLGLYICQIIMEAHGGKITVNSEAGIGTSICLSMPFDCTEREEA